MKWSNGSVSDIYFVYIDHLKLIGLFYLEAEGCTVSSIRQWGNCGWCIILYLMIILKVDKLRVSISSMMFAEWTSNKDHVDHYWRSTYYSIFPAFWPVIALSRRWKRPSWRRFAITKPAPPKTKCGSSWFTTCVKRWLKASRWTPTWKRWPTPDAIWRPFITSKRGRNSRRKAETRLPRGNTDNMQPRAWECSPSSCRKAPGL